MFAVLAVHVFAYISRYWRQRRRPRWSHQQHSCLVLFAVISKCWWKIILNWSIAIALSIRLLLLLCSAIVATAIAQLKSPACKPLWTIRLNSINSFLAGNNYVCVVFVIHKYHNIESIYYCFRSEQILYEYYNQVIAYENRRNIFKSN